MPRKKVVKKPVKQKQKQNVNVKQNVKVIVGDVKRKQVRKATGQKSGATAKPPVLNISNPQPNNMFMEYFKKQLQNQQPIQATTLTEQVLLKEKQEKEASKAGLLGKLVSEPDDQERELRRQRLAVIERFQRSEAVKKSQGREMVGSIRKIPKEPKETKSAPRVNKPQVNPPFYRMPEKPFEEEEQEEPSTPESLVLSELKEQRDRLERQITNPYEALEDEETRTEFPATVIGGADGAGGAGAGGAGGVGAGEEEGWTITPKKKGRGRPKGSTNKKK